MNGGRIRHHHVLQHRSLLAGVEAFSYSTDASFPRHSHDHFGIGVVLQGAHRSWSCIGHVEAGAGDVIMVNPGEVHDGSALDGQPRSWCMLYVEPDLVAQFLSPEVVASEIVRPAVTDISLAASFRSLFAAVVDGRSDVLQRDEGLLCLLMQAARRHGARKAPRPAGTAAVVAARQRLDDTLDCNTTLAELAAIACVSRFQLLRSFARETGLTPHAYLLQRRLNAAKALLASGETPAAVAHALGFSDQSHLTRAFKRQFGVTPGRYRMALA